MAKAYKCDRCGKFYERNIITHENEKRYLVAKHVKSVDIREHDVPIDLCGDCQDAFEKFLLKRMFTPEEVAQTVYQYGLDDPKIPLTDNVCYTPKKIREILEGMVDDK